MRSWLRVRVATVAVRAGVVGIGLGGGLALGVAVGADADIGAGVLVSVGFGVAAGAVGVTITGAVSSTATWVATRSGAAGPPQATISAASRIRNTQRVIFASGTSIHAKQTEKPLAYADGSSVLPSPAGPFASAWSSP
jgi:hypothetical protein